MPENDIALALADLKGRLPRYALYEDYFNGRHRLAFATDKFRNTFGQLFQAFAENTCPAVIDPVSDRLALQGFTVEIGPEEAADKAWEVWQQNRMDQRAVEVHLEALRAGDAYVIVWPDAAGQPVIYPQKANRVTVRYDDEAVDQINWAAKVWVTDDKYVRLTMYYPDRIEKYRTRQPRNQSDLPSRPDEFEQFQVEGEAWPLPNPYGVVPVFHFPNNSDIGHWGRSELVNVIPLQDALNKSIADMLVAMEYVALPQRYATGVELEFDPETGKAKEPWKAGVDRIIVSQNPEARYGEFAAADLSQFLQVQDRFTFSIARVSGTPAHYMMIDPGTFPSGEAMKTAEARFVAKVRDRMTSYGNAWESVVRFALRVQGVTADPLQLSATWNDPAPRSDRDHVEQISRKYVELGISQRQAWAELGYSDDIQDRMEAERRVSDEQVGGEIMRAYLAGTNGRDN